MPDVTLRIDGLKELGDALDQVSSAIATRWVNGGLRAGVKQLVSVAAPLVPRLSGNLASTLRWSSWKGAPDASTRDYAVVIGKHRAPTDPYYALFVERGTQPHLIPATTGHFLHWGSLFSTTVQHPGSKPEPFLEQSLEQGAQAALDAFKFYLGGKLDIPTLPAALASPD